MGLAFVLAVMPALSGGVPRARSQHIRKHERTGAIASFRSRAESAIEHELPGDQAALLEGVALGDDSGLSRSMRQSFKRASLTHVTAASGQNITLLLALLLPILGMAGFGFRTRLVLSALAIAAYVPLAGGEAPIRRAAVMGLALIAARWRGGRAAPVHSLLLAGAVTAGLDRSAPKSIGWQLSFVAVAGMLLIGPPVGNMLRRLGIPELFAEPLSATVAATMATSPLIAGFSGRFSVVAIPANLVAAPAVALSMWLGMVAAALGQFGWLPAAPAVDIAALPVSAVLETAAVFSSPGWAVRPWHPGGRMVLIVLLALLCVGLLAARSSETSGNDPARP